MSAALTGRKVGYALGYGIAAIVVVAILGAAVGVIVGAYWSTFFAGWLGAIPWSAALGIGLLFAVRGAVKTVVAQAEKGWPDEILIGKELDDEQSKALRAALERPGTRVH